MNTGRSKIGIFILCYNVSYRVRDVLLSLPPAVYERVDRIVVVDNCSTDDTVAMAQSAVAEKKLTKVRILKNKTNYGYGGSHKVAFDYLTKEGMDYAVLLHGDGQGDPMVLEQLIAGADEELYDFVIGSRFLDTTKLSKEYSFLRRAGNQGLIALQKWISGLNMTDPGSGELAYSLQFLKRVPYHQLTDTFHFTPQLMLYCRRFQITFKEFPLHWKEAEVSSVNIWQHGWNMLKMLLSYKFRGVKLERQKTAADYSTEDVTERQSG